MRKRNMIVLCALSLMMAGAGCDTSGTSSDDDAGGAGGLGGGGGRGSGTQVAPVLLDVSFQGDGVSVGSEIELIGLNFSSDLALNKVTFAAGFTEIEGVPIRVAFPSDGDNGNGLESRLLVVVPGGVSAGSVTLTVNGVLAGARGYSAAPQIMAVTIGRNRDQEALLYEELIGGFEQNSFVELHGLNFSELTEVRLEDNQGNVQRLPTNTIQRTIAPRSDDPDAPPPNGYSVIGLSLKDERNDVRLNFPEDRENMRITLVGPGGGSNTVEVPVLDFAIDLNSSPDSLGAVVNGIKIPTGARTGPVRVKYVIYEGEVSAAWKVTVEWKLVSEGEGSWRIAKPATDDPEHDGVRGILCGTLAHQSGLGVFPGGGSIRTFSWDAPNDPLLCDLNERQILQFSGSTIRRHWPIQFRITPEIDVASASRTTQRSIHSWVTPTLLYYYLEAMPGDDNLSSQTEREVVENFLTDEREDRSLTTAKWGPPNNIGALQGDFPETTISLVFGAGAEDVVLGSTVLPAGIQQFWTIDTDEMRIAFNEFDPGESVGAEDDTLTVTPLGFVNPGLPDREFHFRTFRIDPDVQVFATGSNPLVMRCSGTGDPNDEVFVVEGLLDANGQTGGFTPIGVSINQTLIGGEAGEGGPGSGAGGIGATLIPAAPVANGAVLELTQSGRGENQGGWPGETTAGLNFNQNLSSSFWGGPGGGGGAKVQGGAGDSGTPIPPDYQPPRAGAGGCKRGEESMIELTPGSGGGGGGATLSRSASTALLFHLASGGGGGGGGGGVVHIVADGGFRVEGSGSVEVNGGNGGDAGGVLARQPDGSIAGQLTAGGAGGGGSGGSLLIQTSGSVSSPCDALQASGGLPGLSGVVSRSTNRIQNVQNLTPGAGQGSPGYIRIEADRGGAPTCSPLAAENPLVGSINSRGDVIDCFRAIDDLLVVEDASTFPPSGHIAITGLVGFRDRQDNCTEPGMNDDAPLYNTIQTEEVRYFAKSGNSLFRLERGVNGTQVLDFQAGADAVLKGSIVPFDVDALVDNAPAPSPDPIEVGKGADGQLHVRFIPSLDASSGGLLRNELDELISVWTFNTDSGVLLNPLGDPVLEVASSATDPGFIDVTTLVIDENTILRASGSNPLSISVSEEADIQGTIDVSGFDGGALRFDSADPSDPGFGLGGEGGPAGGVGGNGGTTVFVDGDLTNPSPENTVPVNGEPGGLPPGTPEDWDQTPVPYGSDNGSGVIVIFPGVTRPTGGSSVRGQPCGTPSSPAACDATAGGGAGGGNLATGDDGNTEQDFPIGFPPVTELLPGAGGSAFVPRSGRFGGELWLFGGPGGSGGGAHPQTSSAYRLGILDSTQVLFGGKGSDRKAVHAPGTGGGGGGGVLLLVGKNLFLRDTARVLARGGNAAQSIDLGGNGGGGAGGNVIIQARNSLTIGERAQIDVSGGLANGGVPIDPGQQLPVYEGNLNQAGGTAELQFFGGVGGDGAPGQIRVEVEADSQMLSSGVNSAIATGNFLRGTYPTVAFSKPIKLSVGPGDTVGATNLVLSGAIVRSHEFGRPLGTASAVLWEGAEESLDEHGKAGDFQQRELDLRNLKFSDYVRFSVPFKSNVASRESQSLRDIRFQYRYEPRLDTGCGLSF